MTLIRLSVPADDGAIWQVLEPVIRAGETYALPRDWDRDAALAFWAQPGHSVYVAEDEGEIVGTYFLRANKKGPGDHVANCGYVTGEAAQGKGVARAMLEHSLETARLSGFRAMQFNAVVATNLRALDIWQKAGFEITGANRDAFRHPESGFVDTLILYRRL